MKNLLIFPILIITFSIGYGQWTTTNLSEPKYGMSAVALPNSHTFWFAGGLTEYGSSKDVEVYNAETHDWNLLQLSEARALLTGLAYDDHLFFAGGMNWATLVPSAKVDIWDNTLNEWSTAQLSVPRLGISAVGGGGKVLFAGGINFIDDISYDIIDVYDTATKQWSTTALSSPRTAMGSAVVETADGQIALFAGGFDNQENTVTDLVDIYNFSTGTWSTARLSEPRAFMASSVIGNKVLFAGGTASNNQSTDRVDVFDASTGEWTADRLSEPRGFFEYGASACGQAFFVGGGYFELNSNIAYDPSDIVDIYDPITDTWSALHLNREILFHSVVSDGDYLLIGGGFNPNLGFDYSTVDVYTCPANATVESRLSAPQYRIYPNPNTGSFFLEKLGDSPQKPATAKVFNLLGKLVFEKALSTTDAQIEMTLPAGSYVLTIIMEGELQTEKVIVQ